MGIFNTIMDKIFHHPAAAPPGAAAAAPPAAAASAPATAAPAAQPVDVEAVLTKIAAGKGGASNWRQSIVDLLKLLDMDSSLTARKELGNELNVHVGADGSAEQNLALHKAVMNALATNGGKVPDSLRH
jgi:3-oxoacyl-ACP reductase-like protein